MTAHSSLTELCITVRHCKHSLFYITKFYLSSRIYSTVYLGGRLIELQGNFMRADRKWKSIFAKWAALHIQHYWYKTCRTISCYMYTCQKMYSTLVVFWCTTERISPLRSNTKSSPFKKTQFKSTSFSEKFHGGNIYAIQKEGTRFWV